MTHMKSEIGIFNYFCNSITYSSQIRIEFVIEKKWISNFIGFYKWTEINS